MIEQLDLKLLKFLIGIYDTGSVSIAGRQIGLSQPASSNALARLREALRDPLFVRGKEGMAPTAFAATVVPGIRAHLAGITGTLLEAAKFDPATSTRTFRLSLSGLGEQVFFPNLAQRLATVAPAIKLETISVALADLPQALAEWEVDVAVGILTGREKALRETHLFDEIYCVVGRSDSANSGRKHIDLRSRKIILVAPSATYAEDIESLIDSAGLSDNIHYRLRHFGALPELLRKLDAVAVVPGQLAERLREPAGVSILQTKLPTRRRAVKLLWHQKTEHEPACVWLRGVIRDLYRQPAQ